MKANFFSKPYQIYTCLIYLYAELVLFIGRERKKIFFKLTINFNLINPPFVVVEIMNQ